MTHASASASASASAPAPESSAQPLLQVENLSVAYGRSEVVSDVSFTLNRGESLALIGESGSGKSTIARAILRLLPDGGRAAGSIRFEGKDVLAYSPRQFRPLRGTRIGFVPQDPANALNPVRTIGSQAHEAADLVDGLSRDEQRELIFATFERVGLPDPKRVYESYPHQLSGGMLQRVLIGLAVLPSPELLIADEPTSALDVTIQKRILGVLSELQSELGIGLVLITHDLAIAAERTQKIVVLKGGEVQESGATEQVFTESTSPYTVRLRQDAPALNPDRYGSLLQRDSRGAAAEQVAVAGVSKSFSVGERRVAALDNVSFTVRAGTTHALVGESGSGKTTAVRILLGLEEADAGEVRVGDERVDGSSPRQLREIRRHLQLVYQNPFTSLDPTWRVERIVREPLDRYKVGDKRERAEKARAALASVGLGAEFLSRKPSALSGGQRQRVAIARALVLRPDVLVLDEPTSALDVTVQAEIFEVLFQLQAELGLTYLFVSHDLALVRQVADTVSVLQGGKVVESGRVAEVLAHPEQPYTRALIDAIPTPGFGHAVPAADADATPAVQVPALV
ncbi:ABC transporter ATP-binding protein [Pseudoclavibacter sp. RFBG4]|uniref:dipeptide ABC transporter ATP-binding protein n=1 Tax=Pseudoclavibacter sp. RFBG4 TaxID=2080575 RepID=UPI000CE7F301|nr:ABC transporter ATP-binding protein [Pseudoclavibacter sp. RFBG4]PPG26465.1 ABC transporter ATP-binding protein [Pseudoclavibacter sp. RFBG4]